MDQGVEVGAPSHGLIKYGDKKEQIIIEGINTSYNILGFLDIVPDMFDRLIQPITPTVLLRIQILLPILPITKKIQIDRGNILRLNRRKNR